MLNPYKDNENKYGKRFSAYDGRSNKSLIWVPDALRRYPWT